MVLDGVPLVLGNLQRLRTTLTRDGNQSAWNQAQHLYSRTRAVVPYLDGDLYESAYIVNIGDKDFPMWAVGYDTDVAPHAITVHEEPNRNHPTRGPSREPKQDHYLSEPRDAMESTFPKAVAKDLQSSVAGIRFPTAPSRRRR
jgi:hypothetical protein